MYLADIQPSKESMRDLAVPVLIAFCSGAAALVYEIVWMRVFTPVFGLSIYATTAVLCAFMAGLGLGSVIAPRVIALWGRSVWVLYALLEVGIGVGALAIPYSVEPITRAYVAAAGMDSGEMVTGLVRFALSFSVMVIPTFFMGLTLPVLVHACRALVAEDPVTSKRVGVLYGLNTVGAAAGCMLVGFVLLYELGVRGTIHATVTINFALAGLVIILYGRRAPSVEPAPIGAGVSAPADPRNPFPAGLILLLYGVIGFTSFGYELSWFRLLVFYLQSATYSFSAMLTVFLVGVGLGSTFFSHVVEPRLRRSRAREMGFVLAIVQALVALFGVATIPLFVHLQEVWGVLLRLTGAESWLVISLQKFAIAGVLIFPPTFLMGVTFPLVARLYKARKHADATTVGMLYGANTLGAVAGTLTTGFVLFDLLGVQRTLITLSTLNLAVAAVLVAPALRSSRLPRVAFAVVSISVIALALVTPPRMLVERFARASGGEIVFYSESASDIMYVVERPDGHRQLHFNDGRGTSATLWEPNYVNRLLAYSAMVMNPDAKDVLVISMGVGNTAAAFTKFDIDRLDIVDISEGPFIAAGYFFTNDGVLDDPRVQTYVEDGRNFLLKNSRKYDVIQIELPSIHADGVVTLYTREFYELAKRALRDKGVLSQWIDASQARRKLSYTLINTMREVFPGSIVWAAKHAWWINGKKGELNPVIEYERARNLFDLPRVSRDARRVRSSLEDLMAKIVSSGALLEASVGRAPVATDDRTMVDFALPRLSTPRAVGGGVAHMGSPVQGLFFWYWRQIGSELQEVAMLPFYSGDHASRVDASLESVASGFPAAVLSRIRKRNDRWD